MITHVGRKSLLEIIVQPIVSTLLFLMRIKKSHVIISLMDHAVYFFFLCESKVRVLIIQTFAIHVIEKFNRI